MSKKSQANLKSYFGVKRRREDEHGAVKRRKLDHLTREDIPIMKESNTNLDTEPSQKKVLYKIPKSPSKFHLPSPKKSPITAKSCQSPRKTPSSPRVIESRGAAALRMALGKSPATPKSPLPTSSATVEESPKLEKFETFEFKSPQKKPRASRRLNYSLLTQRTPAEERLNSEEGSSGTKVFTDAKSSKSPAYQRFHSLAQPQSSSNSMLKSVAQPTETGGSSLSKPRPQSVADLPLPYSYQLLAEKFRSVDTVTSMLQKRSEIGTFDKLRQSVQQMTRRNFEQKNLAQIKTVYPEAYFFRQEKNIPGTTDRTKYSQYQLTVECTAHEGVETEGGAKKLPMGKGLHPAAMISRRKMFNRNLMDIVVNHHQTFLSTLDPPIEVPPDKLFRWHPAFHLDGVPEVEESDLPKPPLTESYTTAKDVLEATKHKVQGRMKAALEATAAANQNLTNENTGKKTPVSVDPSLRGVSSGLLERIRQKETARARANMMRDPVKEKQLAILNRLPEMCSIIRSFFITERKAALVFDDVVRKVKESHSSGITPDQVEEHLEVLLDVLKEWIQKVYVKKTHYLKLKNKNATLKKLNQTLQERVAELQGSSS